MWINAVATLPDYKDGAPSDPPFLTNRCSLRKSVRKLASGLPQQRPEVTSLLDAAAPCLYPESAPSLSRACAVGASPSFAIPGGTVEAPDAETAITVAIEHVDGTGGGVRGQPHVAWSFSEEGAAAKTLEMCSRR